MTINKAALAAGDRSELLKLARTITRSEPRDRNANPLTSQFFDPDPSNVRPLSTSELVTSLAGHQYNDNLDGTQALRDSLHQGDGDLEMFGIKFTKPKTADVSMIGRGPLPRSGWTPPQNVVITTKAGKFEAPVQFKKAAKTENTAHSGLLAETLKSICVELLGLSVENFDPKTLKTRIATALKTARPEVRKRLVKALGMAA